MIDKPKSRMEKLLDGFFQWCRNLSDHASEKLEQPKEILRAITVVHPLLTKIVTATFCVAAVSYTHMYL